jgi:hypothetical protein
MASALAATLRTAHRSRGLARATSGDAQFRELNLRLGCISNASPSVPFRELRVSKKWDSACQKMGCLELTLESKPLPNTSRKRLLLWQGCPTTKRNHKTELASIGPDVLEIPTFSNSSPTFSGPACRLRLPAGLRAKDSPQVLPRTRALCRAVPSAATTVAQVVFRRFGFHSRG